MLYEILLMDAESTHRMYAVMYDGFVQRGRRRGGAMSVAPAAPRTAAI
jgi:hypothetical protein